MHFGLVPADVPYFPLSYPVIIITLREVTQIIIFIESHFVVFLSAENSLFFEHLILFM